MSLGPHVAMQVPAWLAGLAAAWERRWSLGRRGPSCSPTDVLSKGLAGGPTRVLPWHRGRPRQGSCRGSCGFPRLGSRRGSPSSGPHLILRVYDLDKDLHATTEVPPKPWLQCGCWRRSNPRAQGWLALLVLGNLPRQGSCRGRGGRPGKGLPGGVHLVPLLFVSLVLALPWLSCAPAPLFCPAQCGRGRGSDCPCTSKGVKRRAPTFVTPTKYKLNPYDELQFGLTN